MANIDAAEQQKFNQLADRWWEPSGEFHTLHAINPLRLQFIQSRVTLYGKNVLDVGCGGGILTESLARAGANASGIDIAPDVIKVAKNHAKHANLNINYQMTTIEELAAQQPHHFEVITCMEMLEHVPDPLSVITACQQLLKPNGHLFLSTINRNPKAFVKAIIGAEYILRLLPKGTHEYAKFIRPAELSRWLRQVNLHVNDMAGIDYHPFNKTFSLTTDVSVNYIVHCQ